MIVKQLKEALKDIDDEVEVRVHVNIKGETIGGWCLVVESVELEDFDKDVDPELIIQAKEIVRHGN